MKVVFPAIMATEYKGVGVVRNYLCTGSIKHSLKTTCGVIGIDVENNDIDGCDIPNMQ